MSGSAAVAKLAVPYSQLAADYDATLGIPQFLKTRSAFERLVRQYGIDFRSAADIGCGTGLFARHLNLSRRIAVFAIDRSAPMLRIATRNCCGTNVVLLQQDLRRLRLPRPVDLITANFDTLNHIVDTDDLRQTFKRVMENLNPGGHFMFDLVTNCSPRLRHYVKHFRCGFRRVTQTVRVDPIRKLISIFVSVRSPDSGKPIIEQHCERAYSPAELGQALRVAGFMTLGVHAAATSALAGECPARIIVVARKRSDQMK